MRRRGELELEQQWGISGQKTNTSVMSDNREKLSVLDQKTRNYGVSRRQLERKQNK